MVWVVVLGGGLGGQGEEEDQEEGWEARHAGVLFHFGVALHRLRGMTELSLTPDLERFAEACVASGRYESVSAVARAGLQMLIEREARREAFVDSLVAAEAEGVREGSATIAEMEAEMRAALAAAALEG